ncbi:MAG: SDR family NAD(P)-dependent oxidoreductase, partial [Acidobacteria bacterium]|nr:SDR family NAD(P)-dependent oxidoreductase [Acidobacteriota bacterium]
MLNGSVAFVTGGGRGIGRAIALAFASHGARVAVTARSRDQVDAVAREIAAAGGRAAAVTCDVTSGLSVSAAIEVVTRQLGAIAVLVNSAGLAESAPFHRL